MPPPTDSYDSILLRLAEREHSRIYGKYRGTVSDIGDPDKICRIRANVPAVYGETESPWAIPCLPFAGPQHGLVLLPEVGDGVWIEFEGGDIDRPIWSGCWFASDQRPSPDGDKARLLATSAWHSILIDEDADEIKITHPGGAELTMGKSEVKITLGSSEIKMSTSEISLNSGTIKLGS